MESNSSKNSRDYWGNQQVRKKLNAKFIELFFKNYFLLLTIRRRQVQRRVEKIRIHRQATRDEVLHQRKARVEQRAFHKTLVILSEQQMELQRRLKCKQMQCLRVAVVVRSFLQCNIVQTN